MSRGGVLPRPLGTVVENEILALASRYNITINHYVVMPNHVHILLTVRRDGQSPSPTPALGNIIGAFKSITTKKINQTEGTPGRKFWQRSYYDHIVRHDADYLRIWQYIDENPARWAEDEYYTS